MKIHTVYSENKLAQLRMIETGDELKRFAEKLIEENMELRLALETRNDSASYYGTGNPVPYKPADGQ